MHQSAVLVVSQAKKILHWFFIMMLVIPLLTGCDNSKIIVHELDEKESNEILNVLSSKGIDAVKIKSGDGGGGGGSKVTLWNISVPADKASEAMSILNQSGLPRRRGQNLLNIFGNVGLVPSEMTEKIRYQAGLSETLASVIRKMDGVLDAEVQISFPEEDPLNPGQMKQKMTASVYVKYSPLLDDPNAHLATKIKRLVASGVPGLDYDNVTVILDRARFANIESTDTTAREEKNFVNIWTIVVAQESVSRFRVVFFSFIVLILLLLIALGWLFWKIFPVAEKSGGLKSLFSLAPLAAVKPEEKEENPDDKKDDGDGKPKEAADAEIDET